MLPSAGRPHAPAKKCLQFGHTFGYDFGDGRIVRCDLQRRVDKQAAEPVLQRFFDYFGRNASIARRGGSVVSNRLMRARMLASR